MFQIFFLILSTLFFIEIILYFFPVLATIEKNQTLSPAKLIPDDDPTIGFTFKKNYTTATFKTNSKGFREFNRSYSNSNKIYLLGDSLLSDESKCDTQALSTLLYNKINKTKNDYSIFDYGLRGYNTTNQYGIFKRYIFPELKSPGKKNIYLLYALDDINFDYIITKSGDNLDYKQKKEFKIRTVVLFKWAFKEFKKRLKQLLNIKSKESGDYHFQQYKNAYYNTEPNNKNFKRNIDLITKMNEYCKDLNIRFKVIIIPFRFQVGADDVNVLRPQKELIKAFNKNGIKYIDLYNAFYANRNKKLYMLNDGTHLELDGNKILIDIICFDIEQK